MVAPVLLVAHSHARPQTFSQAPRSGNPNYCYWLAPMAVITGVWTLGQKGSILVLIRCNTDKVLLSVPSLGSSPGIGMERPIDLLVKLKPLCLPTDLSPS